MAKLTLKGSCHCQAVKFSLKSENVFPYQRCYCSICRKTQGGGGYAINISGDARTMKVQGRRYIKVYHARMKARGDKHAHRSTGERHFCGACGTALWVFSPEWPELIHPFASCIDTPLPQTPETTHMMLGSKAPWVDPHFKPGDKKFKEYSEESIAEWHERHRLTGKGRNAKSLGKTSSKAAARARA